MKKVKNKFTDNIDELGIESKTDMFTVEYYDLKTKETVKIYYSTLEDLCREWQDCEDYHIDFDGSIMKTSDIKCNESVFKGLKAIGNYFGTEEEAEKAVKKLEAWKRLKDSGFTIKQWRHTPDMNLTIGSFINIKGFIPEVVKNIKDLDMLFGGEE